jgi:hypothetical protein
MNGATPPLSPYAFTKLAGKKSLFTFSFSTIVEVKI